MKQSCFAAVGIVVLLLWLAAFPTVASEKSASVQAYLEYQAAVTKAATLDDILPHVSSAYRAMLTSRPKKDHPMWLENLKEGVMNDVKVSKDTITGNTCTLEATATSKRGNAMKGTIILVREDKAWKLDEEFWTMVLPEGLQ